MTTQDWFSALREATQIDSELLRQANRLRLFLENSLGWSLIHDQLMFSEEDEVAFPALPILFRFPLTRDFIILAVCSCGRVHGGGYKSVKAKHGD
jgi:hypothetical protein